MYVLQKILFLTYLYIELILIYLVYDTTNNPQVKGSVHFSLPIIGKVLLSNFQYVPSFKKNFFLGFGDQCNINTRHHSNMITITNLSSLYTLIGKGNKILKVMFKLFSLFKFLKIK